MVKNVFLLLLLVAISSCSVSTLNDQDLKSDLEEGLVTFNEAFRKGDLQILNEMTTTDYVHTNGQSEAFGKDSWFNYLRGRSKQIEDGTLSIDKYEFSDVKISLHGHTAIVNGKVSVSGKREGVPFSNQFRVTHLWVYENNSWKRAGFHDTKIDP